MKHSQYADAPIVYRHIVSGETSQYTSSDNSWNYDEGVAGHSQWRHNISMHNIWGICTICCTGCGCTGTVGRHVTEPYIFMTISFYILSTSIYFYICRQSYYITVVPSSTVTQ